MAWICSSVLFLEESLHELFGCREEEACNYDATATKQPDDSCDFPPENDYCEHCRSRIYINCLMCTIRVYQKCKGENKRLCDDCGLDYG